MERSSSKTQTLARQLIRNGENQCVEFKLTCSAFKERSHAVLGELAKDICALANNSPKPSFLLIGISNDRRGVKSVDNLNLTDDNLQSFLNDAIRPHVKCKLEEVIFDTGPQRYRDKRIVLISLKGNERAAYHLNRDFIEHAQQKCYRRNEVWIRRGATNDLASPEEVVALSRKFLTTSARRESRSRAYNNLIREKRLEKIGSDFAKIVTKHGGRMDGDRVVFKFGNKRYVFRLIVMHDCRQKHDVWIHSVVKWSFEHGVIILSHGGISSTAFHREFPINCRQKWGWITQFDLPRFARLPDPYNRYVKFELPLNTNRLPITVLSLQKIDRLETLERLLVKMNQQILNDEDLLDLLSESRELVNGQIRQWKRQGMLYQTDSYVIGKKRISRKQLQPGEVTSRLFPGRILRRAGGDLLHKVANGVLRLSNASQVRTK